MGRATSGAGNPSLKWFVFTTDCVVVGAVTCVYWLLLLFPSGASECACFDRRLGVCRATELAKCSEVWRMVEEF